MMLYDQIETALRNQQEQLSVPEETTEEEVHACIRTVMRTHPEIFWFSHQWDYSEERHTVFFRYAMSKNRTARAKAQIEDVVRNDFRLEAVRRLSTSEQVMYVYKWVALYCKYNLYSAFNQSIYSVFVYRNSVCTGYAKAAQYLLKMLGIESRLVFGTLHHAEKGSRHCWLVVKIDDAWYHLDPTFAVPEVANLLRNAGENPVVGASGLVTDYFCCDTFTIKQSRSIEDERELPECRSTIDSKELQAIPVAICRRKEAGSLGVRGCLLSDAGTYSDVYLWHSEHQEQGVLKKYRGADWQGQLQHEFLVMRSLEHSRHVLHLLDYSLNDGGLIIEQATPLADLLCSHYYSLSTVGFCRLLLDVTAGLADCLAEGFYFRDLHLNNIYRTSKGDYVLGDFGSCIRKDARNQNSQGGVGSPWYLAPETLLSGRFNEPSATYGVGMLAYHLLNNFFPPLWKEYGKESLRQRLQGRELPLPTRLMKAPGAFERELASVLSRSLSFNPDARYQTLLDFEKAMRHCLLLAKENDCLLVDGGNSERLFQFAEPVVFHLDGSENGIQEKANEEFVLEGSHTIQTGTFENEADIDCDFSRLEEDELLIAAEPATRINDFASTASLPEYSPANERDTVRPLPSPASRGENMNIARKSSPRHDWQVETENQPTTYAPRPKRKLFSGRAFLGGLFRRKKNEVEDEVFSSVFAPAEIKPKTRLMVQVYLHQYEETERVVSLAKEAQEDALRRDYIPLHCKLRRGDRVDACLNIYGESLLMSESKSIVWMGSFTKCSFDFLVSEKLDVEELSCQVMLRSNAIPVGELRFVVKVVESPKKLNPEITAHKYKKVFISYSHLDEPKVRSFHEGLKLAGVDHFFDRSYLGIGDVFPQVIRDYINTADLFVLFWSANASKSEYVEIERRQALERAYPQVRPQQAAKLSIYPMSIEPRAELPNDMKGFYHFGEL